jgi:hypothetical protein
VSAALAVLGALTQKQSHGNSITTEGRIVGTVLLLTVGVASLVVSRVGWRHAGAIVPSSLPDELYWKRVKVIRRGAVTFAVLGVLFVAMSVWVVATA